jgi:hypothetical protein
MTTHDLGEVEKDVAGEPLGHRLRMVQVGLELGTDGHDPLALPVF